MRPLEISKAAGMFYKSKPLELLMFVFGVVRPLLIGVTDFKAIKSRADKPCAPLTSVQNIPVVTVW